MNVIKKKNHEPKSLFEQSARIVVKQIRFCSNLWRLRGEIPLTVIRYLSDKYLEFTVDFLEELENFFRKYSFPDIMNLQSFHRCTFKLDCVKYDEWFGLLAITHIYCNFCFKNYIMFKIPTIAHFNISNYRNHNVTMQGIDFLDDVVDYMCHNCGLLVIKPEGEDKQSCVDLNL